MATRASPGALPRLRRDAARNRQRILDVAGEVFATQGLAASMNDIATAAGVGVGTVYRRFPDRSDLIRAVFDQRVKLIEVMTAQAAADPDPWAGLVRLMEEGMALEAADRGLAQLFDDEELLRSMAACSHSIAGRADTIRAAMQELVTAAQRAGKLRPDAGLGDLLLVKRMVTEVARATRSVRPDQWRRMLSLCLDGLRAPGSQPLPGSSLTLADLKRAVEHSASRARRS